MDFGLSNCGGSWAPSRGALATQRLREGRSLVRRVLRGGSWGVLGTACRRPLPSEWLGPQRQDPSGHHRTLTYLDASADDGPRGLLRTILRNPERILWNHKEILGILRHDTEILKNYKEVLGIVRTPQEL